MKTKTVIFFVTAFLTLYAFGSETNTRTCEGKFSKGGTAMINMTTLGNDISVGWITATFNYGVPRKDPKSFSYKVQKIDNPDSDSDVSALYQGMGKGNSQIRFKMSEDPHGESYISNLPGFKSKIALNCK